MPACDIAVPDQKHPILRVEHNGADAERHAASEAPIEMQTPPQQRLQARSQVLQIHRLGYPALMQAAFDPCIAVASLPLHGREVTGYDDMMAPWLTDSGRLIGRM